MLVLSSSMVANVGVHQGPSSGPPRFILLALVTQTCLWSWLLSCMVQLVPRLSVFEEMDTSLCLSAQSVVLFACIEHTRVA